MSNSNALPIVDIISCFPLARGATMRKTDQFAFAGAMQRIGRLAT
jgi:hypothetical protein